MAETQNPLTPEDLTRINDALDTVTTAEHQLALAKRAGIDVSAQEQQIARNKERLLQIKQVYFPDQ